MYYFDMDGVISIYDDTMKDKTILFEDRIINQRNQHYFQNLIPEKRIAQVIHKLYEQQEQIFVLSHTTNDIYLAVEHLHDKQVWISKKYPMIKAENLLWIPNQTISKAEAVRIMQNHTLSKSDILIDDYNKNLWEWEQAGGTAIKYLNGCNDPESFKGLQITPDMSCDDILHLISQK